MQSMKEMAALTALNDMLAGGSVSICTVRDVAELLGVQPAGEAYQILKTLHCVKFSKMPQELADEVPRMIQEVLGVAPTFQFTSMQPQVIEVNTKPQQEKPAARNPLRLLGLK